MIDSYSFGSITVNGVTYRSDIKILNELVIPNWWRTTGHKVKLSEISDILTDDVEVCVIGQGASGLMQPAADIAPALNERNILLVVQRSDLAVTTYNEHVRAGRCVAAAFHLTC
ncbi:MAG: hypothetical protein JRE23_14115 [Deltaproteobacteria bacterium]|nr:hypothetical protein [Deltaproteobacteria bacterium]